VKTCLVATDKGPAVAKLYAEFEYRIGGEYVSLMVTRMEGKNACVTHRASRRKCGADLVIYGHNVDMVPAEKWIELAKREMMIHVLKLGEEKILKKFRAAETDKDL